MKKFRNLEFIDTDELSPEEYKKKMELRDNRIRIGYNKKPTEKLSQLIASGNKQKIITQMHHLSAEGISYVACEMPELFTDLKSNEKLREGILSLLRICYSNNTPAPALAIIDTINLDDFTDEEKIVLLTGPIAYSASLGIFEILIEKEGIDLNCRDSFGKNILTIINSYRFHGIGPQEHLVDKALLLISSARLRGLQDRNVIEFVITGIENGEINLEDFAESYDECKRVDTRPTDPSPALFRLFNNIEKMSRVIECCSMSQARIAVEALRATGMIDDRKKLELDNRVIEIHRPSIPQPSPLPLAASGRSPQRKTH